MSLPVLRTAFQGLTILLAFAIQFSIAPKTADEILPNLQIPLAIEKTEAKLSVAERPGVPVRVIIPKADIDAAIVPIGLLPSGQLDVPSKPMQVGWYELNARPGEAGNAVLDGHRDVPGSPGVFFHLSSLKPGDDVEVTDKRGTLRTFRVQYMESYHVDTAPMVLIFGPTSPHNLNLITCAGTWRKELDHYDKRLVVFTREIDPETGVFIE